MNNRLRQLFLLAVVSAAGLLCLQVYWIYKEWIRSGDLLQREVDYSFQQAVDKEWERRKDTLTSYLSDFLHDTNFVKFGTRFNEREKVWMTTLYDPANPKDYFTWSNKLYPVSEHLSNEEREGVINRFIQENLRKSIATDVIFFYTQRFGKIWTKKHDDLALDTSLLNRLFQEELGQNKIDAGFSIVYIDTIRNELYDRKGKSLHSKPVLVHLKQINDPERRYVSQANVYDPGIVILKRLWLIGAGSLALLGLTFWCLYRMFKTIIRQKQLDELKDDFISNMTHELKTPIATVGAAIDGLQFYDALNDKERTKRYLEISRKELNRLDGMVSKALELSIEQNISGVLMKEKFLLRPFVEQLLSSFDVQSGFSWQLSIDEDLKVYADKEKLSSLFQNLIENAIKYGGKNTLMHFEAEREGDLLRIVIRDNGPGIDKAYLPYIFNKFYRVPGAGEVKGFGLGLYRVAGIVKAHNGTVMVESKEGLSFVISLPIS
ncbi:HAMP domain-containing histidine kinase [Terrimonas sp. NA20]|uniref:histidine kinase n=1 Tax=Terrimonas ginsenosidimutans TaxID=2908004 RepID=A0ABS9KTV3_9BACT|nr:HAMP domain-containing sensor histidine kinase [Terrimonas ginsenosidimutans]MCG2615753.1 HAMP domain-containing histidine kinase [Terrimonas ginsenosidimutans]